MDQEARALRLKDALASVLRLELEGVRRGVIVAAQAQAVLDEDIRRFPG